MNTHVMIPAFLLAFACPLLMAADAKLDDHGAGHAAPAAQAKPAEPKPADKHAADAKHTADAKPAADAKVAEAHPEESAKAPPKKKRVKKSKKTATHDAHAPTAEAPPGTPSAGHSADAHAGAHGDKAQAAADPHAAPEPSKRLKLRKSVVGATQDAHPSDSPSASATATATAEPPAHGHAVPDSASPAPVASDAHGAPASASHDAHGSPPAAAAPAAASTASAPTASAPAHADPHALVTEAAPSSKRVKLKKPQPAATSATAQALASAPAAKAAAHDAHTTSAPPAASAHDAHGSHDSHDSQASHASAAAPKATPAKDEHAGHDAHTSDTAPTSNAAHTAHDAPATAKALPAHSGHAAMTVAAPRAAEECDMPLKAEIAALFDRWNASLRTGDPRRVVANYAPNSILLPTVSNRARFTIAEKEDYFTHFLMKRPEGSIDDRLIEVDCNSATDSGLYTFRFGDGTKVKARYSFSYKKIGNDWLITSHHSSAMPEQVATGHEAAASHASAPASKAQAAAPREDSGPSTKGWVRFP